MTMFTKKTILISGVSAEYKLITGAMQESMTRNAGNDTDPISTLLQEALVSLGSKKNICKEDIDNLLVNDKQDLLLQIRLDSYDEILSFKYAWDVDGRKSECMHDVFFTVENISRTLPKSHYDEYEEVLKNLTYEVTLPQSGQVIELTKLTNLFHQNFLRKVAKDKVSAITFIELRKPRVKSIDVETQKPRYLACDLRELLAKDLEVLRKAIYANEGNIKAEVEIKNPSNLNQTQKISVLEIPNFFFYME
jgi:hypothetical protein